MKRVLFLLIPLLLGVSLLGVSCGESLDGAPIYQAKCSGCHGVNREGITGPSLIGITLSEDEIEATIRQGRPDTAMPSWEDMQAGRLLTGQEIRAIIKYLLSP